VLHVAGSGASSHPQSLQKGHGQNEPPPSSDLGRGDDQVPSLSGKRVEWEGSPHFRGGKAASLG
jgi:hypothetical protein